MRLYITSIVTLSRESMIAIAISSALSEMYFPVANEIDSEHDDLT